MKHQIQLKVNNKRIEKNGPIHQVDHFSVRGLEDDFNESVYKCFITSRFANGDSISLLRVVSSSI